MDFRLAQLQKLALNDNKIKNDFLSTRKEKEPLVSFSEKCKKYGYEISVSELACLGEESCAEMLRSQNGGGEIEPSGWNDDYELFFLNLE